MHALKKLLTFWQRCANLMVSYCFSVIFTGGHAVKNKKQIKTLFRNAMIRMISGSFIVQVTSHNIDYVNTIMKIM